MAEVPGPLPSATRFGYEITVDGPGGRSECWVMIDGGEVVGGYGLSFSVFDNPHLCWFSCLVVRPERRGRGVGSALLAHAVERARADGRRLLLGETPVTGAGARFARARGFTVAVAEARRVLDLRTADWEALARLTPEPGGYHVERWAGPARPELLADLATVMAGMNDAPRDEDVEAMSIPIERVRAAEERLALTGDDCYTVLARRTSDGAPVGYSRIFLAADRGDGWAHQGDTTVLGEHRGHRLGLLLKLTNLLWVREREPHLDRVVTWNATSNTHMLAINEALGFELLDEWHEWRLPLQSAGERSPADSAQWAV